MYSYMELPDETLITHSQILEEEGIKKIQVHFERPTEQGFDSARAELPSYKWCFNKGYSEKEMAFFTELLRNNAHLLYKYAESGGIEIA